MHARTRLEKERENQRTKRFSRRFFLLTTSHKSEVPTQTTSNIMRSENQRISPAVRTHSLSALSSLTASDSMPDALHGQTLNDAIWDSEPLYVSSLAAEPKGVPTAEGPFPEFRPEGDPRWYRSRRQAPEAPKVSSSQPQAGDLVSPLIDNFADAVSRELGRRLRRALTANVEPESLESLLASTSRSLSSSSSLSQQQQQQRPHNNNNERGGDDDDRSSSDHMMNGTGYQHRRKRTVALPRVDNNSESENLSADIDDVRQTLSNVVMRLSTLEGRQRALQGKMAKLDSAWGGDASQMSLAIAELQHVVANEGSFGSLRGQLIALAHSIDKLDKRTTSLERNKIVPSEHIHNNNVVVDGLPKPNNKPYHQHH